MRHPTRRARHATTATVSQPLPRFVSPAAQSRHAMPEAISWWQALRDVITSLARRPLLAITLGIAIVLLVSASSEAIEAARLDSQVNAARAHNQQLQVELTQTANQIATQTAPTTIMHAAGKLGWVTVTPTMSPSPQP